MPSRRFTVFVLVLIALVLAGTPLEAEEGTGQGELALGREAAARQDHAAAARHFQAALSSFDPAEDREALAETWLQLGLTSLNGLNDPQAALTAFLTSAALAKERSTAWLWASVAAEKLGRSEEAATYKTRALERPAPAPAPSRAPVREEPPVVPVPEPPPALMAEPEPVLEEAPRETPDAVQHFFGEAAVEPEPPPAAEPVREEPAAVAQPAKGDAVQHFFGEGAATERKPGRKKVPVKKVRQREEPAAPAKEPASPAAQDKPEESVDAVQYFFGEKEPAAATAPETAAEEKPPAEM